MSRAFIFDMDGVLVDSESAWSKFEMPMLRRVFGERTTEAIGDTTGLGLVRIWERARAADPSITIEQLEKAYDAIVGDVYANAPMTEGLVELVDFLKKNDIQMGMVTQSPHSWIDKVLPRLPFKEDLETVISLFEHPELRPKPAPDGYVQAIRILGADPKESFILEDSNSGIAAGKAAGAFVIGFRGNLLPGYEQHGADVYADTMSDVRALVEKTIRP